MEHIDTYISDKAEELEADRVEEIVLAIGTLKHTNNSMNDLVLDQDPVEVVILDAKTRPEELYRH